MIIPHESDYVISAMVYSSPLGINHRTVLFRREHPGRPDQYILVQEREDDRSRSVQRSIMDRDITEELYSMASDNPVPILSRYSFFRFKDEPTVKELIDMGRKHLNLERSLQQIFDLSLDDLESVVSWKP